MYIKFSVFSSNRGRSDGGVSWQGAIWWPRGRTRLARVRHEVDPPLLSLHPRSVANEGKAEVRKMGRATDVVALELAVVKSA